VSGVIAVPAPRGRYEETLEKGRAAYAPDDLAACVAGGSPIYRRSLETSLITFFRGRVDHDGLMLSGEAVPL